MPILPFTDLEISICEKLLWKIKILWRMYPLFENKAYIDS